MGHWRNHSGISLQRLNQKFVVNRRERNRTHKTSHMFHEKYLIYRIVENVELSSSAEEKHILSLYLLDSKYVCCLQAYLLYDGLTYPNNS